MRHIFNKPGMESLLDELFRQQRWQTWLKRVTVHYNKLDLRGEIKSKSALDQGLGLNVRSYANHWLDILGKRVKLEGDGLAT